MIDVEFQGEMVRLINAFSVKAFPSERTKLIWDEVNDMGISWFRHLVSQMIGDMRFAPLLKDFREAAVKERSSLNSTKAIEAIGGWADFDSSARPTCLYCGDEGFVDCWKLPSKIYRKQFRCKCEAARKYPNYPQWHRGMSNEYELEVWGEPVTPEQAKTLRDKWRVLFATNTNELEAAIGWQKAKSAEEQRQIANTMMGETIGT